MVRPSKPVTIDTPSRVLQTMASNNSPDYKRLLLEAEKKWKQAEESQRKAEEEQKREAELRRRAEESQWRAEESQRRAEEQNRPTTFGELI